MNIVFTELFNKECRDKFQVSEAQVEQAITSPNEQEVAKLDELEIRFFVKQMLQAGDKYYLLVCTRWDGSNLLVDLAFRILPDFVEELRTLKPIILLQQLTLKFGLTIRVGQQFSKFIFRELIPLKLSDEPTKLVEVVNPENHSFMQSMLIKIEQEGDTKIANCALAYCIDSDRYLSWLTGEEAVRNVIINIAAQLRGRITPLDLIGANGTLTFWINYSQLGVGKEGYLFKVATDKYSLEVGFTESSFYIARNGFKLELSIATHLPNGYVNCYAMWQPTKLSLLMLDKSYDEAVSSGADAITETENRTKIIKTPPTLPPNSLITWARKKAIAPITAYDSLPHFYQEITSALQSLSDKVGTVNMYNAFWDIIYKGSQIVSRKPKREPDVLPSIHGLLFDIATSKNLEVSPEYHIGKGSLDFLISGQLKSGETAKACVEFKHAHSTKLLNGLMEQLPAYMRTSGCDFGLYCVIYFRGDCFPKPKKCIEDLEIFLNLKASSAGLLSIRILMFDFSRPKAPSQL